MIAIVDPSSIIDRLTYDLIRERVGRYRGKAADELGRPPVGQVQPAAVLLALFRPEPEPAPRQGSMGADSHGDWRLLFIRRAEHALDRHSGQVGFPGGRREARDRSWTDTALREAEEEIGLDPRQVRLLGELRPLRTATRFLVTPVVGYIPWPLELRPAPQEVSRIFSIPLAWLCEPCHHRVRPYPAPDHPEVRDTVFFDEYDGERLWGVSARIALDLLGCLGGRE